MTETPGYRDMLLLAEKHEELREKCTYPEEQGWTITLAGLGEMPFESAHRLRSINHPVHCVCQGRGWTLSDPKKWLGKLAARCKQVELTWIDDDPTQLPYWHCWVTDGEGNGPCPGFGPTLEAALAAALVVAHD